MDLELTRELLAAAVARPEVPFYVTGHDAAREVELLAQGGFIDASVEVLVERPHAVITRLTDAGEKLLRVLEGSLPA